MTISIPLIALIAIVVYIAYRHMGLRPGTRSSA